MTLPLLGPSSHKHMVVHGQADIVRVQTEMKRRAEKTEETTRQTLQHCLTKFPLLTLICYQLEQS